MSKKAPDYEADQIKRDIADLMATPEFRRYALHLLAFCGDGRTSFTGNSTTYFNEGARNVALKITADLREYATESYIEMISAELRRNKE